MPWTKKEKMQDIGNRMADAVIGAAEYGIEAEEVLSLAAEACAKLRLEALVGSLAQQEVDADGRDSDSLFAKIYDGLTKEPHRSLAEYAAAFAGSMEQEFGEFLKVRMEAYEESIRTTLNPE